MKMKRRKLIGPMHSVECSVKFFSPPKVRGGSVVNSHFSNQKFALFLTLPLLKIYTACFLNNSELMWLIVEDGKGPEQVQIQVL